jgi:hypothetical protein
MSAPNSVLQAPRERAGKPRWLIVYNCVHVGLANCLGLLNQDLEVDAIDFSGFERGFADYRGLLDQYELIVTAPHFIENASVDFRQVGKVCALPLTAFEAYHPDLCYVRADGQILRGPMFDYHSKIVTAAYRRGIPVGQVKALFNGRNYERFGYMGIWGASKKQFLDSYAASGVDLSDRFAGWSREGVFMHSVNHPTIRVINDIARKLLPIGGLEPLNSDFLPQDNLKQAPVFPVYDEIAEALSVRGSYLFKVHNRYRFLSLDEFIAGSYELLSNYPVEKIEVFPMYKRAMDFIEACL